MTLATRCPDCATTFKLTLEQRRAAQGWVRCGRCGSVFLSETEPPSELESAPPQGGPSLADEPPLAARRPMWESALLADEAPAADGMHEQELARYSKSAPIEPQFDAGPDVTVDITPDAFSGAVSGTFPGTFSGADSHLTPDPTRKPPNAPQIAPQIAPTFEPDAGVRHVPERVAAAPAAASTSAPPRSVDELPRFVWESEQTTRPAMAAGARRLWWSLVLLLSASAALQGVILWRNDLASHWPPSREVLHTLCEWLGCRIEPPRQLQALRIESSELRQIGPTLYELQIVVRNLQPQPLLWPAVDLALTDASNKLVARRVLEPAQFGVRDAAIDARRETVLRARLSTGDRAVSGYTVELFYP